MVADALRVAQFEDKWFASDRMRRALARAVRFARVSGVSLIVLGSISAVFSVRDPISASFAISIAVVINGIVETRQARRLELRDTDAPRRLAVNQLFLGGEIAAYAVWQIFALTTEAVEAVMARPMVATLLGAINEPEVMGLLLDMLLPMLRLIYIAVAVGGFLGCAAVALYYHTRRRLLMDPANPPPLEGRGV